MNNFKRGVDMATISYKIIRKFQLEMLNLKFK